MHGWLNEEIMHEEFDFPEAHTLNQSAGKIETLLHLNSDMET